MSNKLNYRLVNVLLLMAIIYIVVATSSYWNGIILKVFHVIIPFFLAFIFAYILEPFVKKLENKGVRRSLAIFLVILIFLTLIVLLIWFTVPTIYEQLVTFSIYITEVISDVSNRFDINLGSYQYAINDSLNEVIKKLGSYISNGTIDILGKSVNFVTNLMIVFIIGIYILKDMDKIREFIKKCLRKHKRGYAYIGTIDHEISSYLHGIALLMIVQLFEYAILFKLVGHPNWLILGVLAFVTTIIPYFGGIIINVIAIVTASVVSSNLFIATIIITLVFSNVDGYIISPIIYGKTNNINPIFVISICLICSSLFGIWGIIMGLPLYLIIRATWMFFNKDIKNYIVDIKDEKIKY